MKLRLVTTALLLLILGNIYCFSQDQLNAKLPKNLREKYFDTIRPLSSDMVRIVFHREGNITGAASPIYLFDRGNNNRGNAFIKQKEYTPNPAGNYSECGNIQSLHLLLDGKLSVLMQGTPATADSFAVVYLSKDSLTLFKKINDNQYVTTNINVQSDFLLTSSDSIPKGNMSNILSRTKVELDTYYYTESNGRSTKIKLTNPHIFVNIYDLVYAQNQTKLNSNYILYSVYKFGNQPYKSNAQFLRFIKSNETIIWDRIPGIMKLECIDGYNCQAFCPQVELQRGHTYYVEFKYGFKPSFKVTDLN